MQPVGRALGRYVLHDEIASGGMGAVHLGQLLGPSGFRRNVAIKRMAAGFAGDPTLLEDFKAEAALSARVQHPNVVATLDVVTEDGETFLVLEYVRGQALSRLLSAARARGERVPVPVAVSIITGVLSGLHAAHEATNASGRPLGLVHRDVSPHNVLVGADGLAKIADFGIAKATQASMADTMDGTVRGKLGYLAPEQLSFDRPIDRRVDVFAAAIVLWEMIAGRKLFTGVDAATLVDELFGAPPPSLAALRADVPSELDSTIAQALSVLPEARPPTAKALAEAIETVVPGLASPMTVGRWVESLALDHLRAVDETIGRIEARHPDDGPRRRRRLPHAGPRAPEVNAPAPAAAPVAPTPASLGDDVSTSTIETELEEPVRRAIEAGRSSAPPQARVSRMPSPRRTRHWAAGALLVVTTLAGVAVALGAREPTRPDAAVPSASPAPSARVAPSSRTTATAGSDPAPSASTMATAPSAPAPSASGPTSAVAPAAAASVPATHATRMLPRASASPPRPPPPPTGAIGAPYVPDRP